MLSNHSKTSAASTSRVKNSSMDPFYMGSAPPRRKRRIRAKAQASESGRGAGIAPMDGVDAGQRLGVQLDLDAVDVLLQLRHVGRADDGRSDEPARTHQH